MNIEFDLSQAPKRTSYSALATFDCPRQYALAYIAKIPDNRPKPAAERGTRLHKAMERFLKGEIALRQLPSDFQGILSELERMKLWHAKAEEVILIEDTNWTGTVLPEGTQEPPGMQFKAVIDVHYKSSPDYAVVKDLKTGKPYGEHALQLEGYVLSVFCAYPEVDTIDASPLYLQYPANPVRYSRKGSLERLKESWKARWDRLFAETEFAPNPSLDNCRFCAYRDSLGGPCEYA